MTRRILLFLSILSSCQVLAQPDSIALGRVVYLRHVDLQGELEKNGPSTLLFNSAYSVFVHNAAPKSDSAYVNPEFVFPVNAMSDPEGFPIYKMHRERRILLKIPCRRASKKKNCVVSDTLGTIQWTLHDDEQRVFGQFTCLKATGSFRGRDYEAWYAPDIPVPSGPFKLGGLPGLILEAQTTDDRVRFLFHSLELSDHIAEPIRLPNGLDLKQSHGDYIAAEDAASQLYLRSLKAETGIDGTITRMETIERYFKDQ
ncbi:MAG: GLPGLI family protein [Saprospiraceae bacterium]